MTREQVIAYARERYGTDPEYLWQDQNAVLRHGETQKWYGVLLKVLPQKLNRPGTEPIDILDVKCSPLMTGSYWMQEGFHPGYHMNKKTWITLRLDGSVPDETVKECLNSSYQLVSGRKPGQNQKHKE